MATKQNLLRKQKGMEGDLKEMQETSSFSLAMGGFHGARYFTIYSVLLCIKNFGKYLNILFNKNQNF